MRPSRCRAIVLGLLLCVAPVELVAQDGGSEDSRRSESSTRESARFLLTPIGARTVGLAGAVTASRADPEGVLWNPASVASLERSAAYFHVASDFGTSSQVLGFLWSWDRAEIGLTYYRFDMGSIEARSEANEPLGTIELDDGALIFTGAYALTESVDLGLNYKLVRLGTSCPDGCGDFDVRSVGHAFDLGVTAALSAVGGLTVGAVLRNLGPDVSLGDSGTPDPMPTRLRIGAAYDLGRALFPREERFDLLISGDLQQTVAEFDDLEGYVGAELSLRRILYLRGGYAWTAPGRRGAALGVGLRYRGIVVDVGRAFDDFSRFDSGTPFQLSLAYTF